MTIVRAKGLKYRQQMLFSIAWTTYIFRARSCVRCVWSGIKENCNTVV